MVVIWEEEVVEIVLVEMVVLEMMVQHLMVEETEEMVVVDPKVHLTIGPVEVVEQEDTLEMVVMEQIAHIMEQVDLMVPVAVAAVLELVMD